MKKRSKLIITLLVIIVLGLAAVYTVMVLTDGERGSDEPFIRDFLPFGAAPEEQPAETETSNEFVSTENVPTEEPLVSFTESESKSRKITSTPSSEAFFYTNVSGNTVIRYFDRQNGSVNDFNLDTGERVNITSTTVLGIIEAVWINKNNAVIKINASNGPRTAIANINEEGGSITTTFLEQGIDDISVSGSGIVYTSDNRVVRSDLFGNTTAIATLPLSGWRVTTSGSKIYIYPKPSSGVVGVLYEIVGSSLRKVVEGEGLVAKAGPNNLVAFSFGINFSDTRNTIADKCVVASFVYCGVPQFTPNGTYPDDWYKGLVSFNDSLVVFEIESDSDQTLPLSESVDITNITLNSDESLLSFVNKKDGSLWVYKLPSNITIEESDDLPPPPPVN